MNWLKKIIINDTEMNIKDDTARTGVQTNAEDISDITEELSNIWNDTIGETTYYVSPSGNDNNDGSSEHPFKTIVRAYNVGMYYVALTNNSFNIRIQSGDYYESATIGAAKCGRKINIWIDGSVNIYGKLSFVNCKANLYKGISGAELHIYYDTSYTTETYGKITLFNCLENADIMITCPLFLHCGNSVCDYCARFDYYAVIVDTDTIYLSGTINGTNKSGIYVSFADIKIDLNIDGLTTSGETITLTNSRAIVRGNNTGTYYSNLSEILSTNMTPIT